MDGPARPKKLKPNDGGPAFPGGSVSYGQPANGHHGMTLRDWFAGQALASDWAGDYSPTGAAEQAYRYADAMLAERTNEPRPQPKEAKLNYVI